MICKECGAYNPDHATYCKVCAANLKGEPEQETTESPVVEDPQPTKRFSRPSWVVPEQAKKAEAPVKEETEEEDVFDDEEEETVEEPVVKPTKKQRTPEPVEEDDVDDDDPDSYETKSDRPIWTPTRANKRKPVEDDEDEDADEDEEDDKKSEPEDDSIYNALSA